MTLSPKSPWSWRADGTIVPTIAADVIALVPIWEDDVTPADQVNTTFTEPSTIGDPTTENDALVGWTIDFDGAGDGLEWDTADSPFGGLTSYTFVLVFFDDGNTGTSIIRKDGTFSFQNSGSGNWQLVSWPNGSISFAVMGPATADKWVCLVATWTAADTDLDWWLHNLTDDTSLTSGTTTGLDNGALANNASNAYRWGMTENGGELFSGNIGFFALFDSKVSDADASSLAVNPYQLIEQVSGNVLRSPRYGITRSHTR